MFRKFTTALLVSTLFLVGCSTLPNLVSEEQLRASAFAQFKAMKEQVPLSKNPAYLAQVDRVSKRIVAVVAEAMPDAEWEFVVFEDDSLNAFAMPGGKIGVHTGMLQIIDTDDELAAVIGHEICHVLLDHSQQRASAQLWRGIGGVATVVMAEQTEMTDEQKAATFALYGLGTEIGLMLPFSRSHETEADEQGILIAARAGYDPRAAITFWEKMKARGSGQPPQFLSTHPSHGNRIERLQELMPQAMEIYQANKS